MLSLLCCGVALLQFKPGSTASTQESSCPAALVAAKHQPGRIQVTTEEREQHDLQEGRAQLLSELHAPPPGPSSSGGPESLAGPLRVAALPSTCAGGAGIKEEDDDDHSNSYGGLQGPMANTAAGV